MYLQKKWTLKQIFCTCYPTRPRPLFLINIFPFNFFVCTTGFLFCVNSNKTSKIQLCWTQNFLSENTVTELHKISHFPFSFPFFRQKCFFCVSLLRQDCVRRAIIKYFLSPFNVFKLSELSTRFGTDRVMSLFAWAFLS